MGLNYRKMSNFVKCLLLFVFVPIMCVGQTREFEKLIKKYDVKQYLYGVGERNPIDYWNVVWRNNKGLMDYLEAVDKSKSTATNARKAVYDALLLSENSYKSLPVLPERKWGIVSDTVLSKLGVRGVASDVKLSIIHSDINEAFVVPNGHIYMSDVLFLTDSLSLNHIIGIAAHEVAHFLLQHVQLEAYAMERKKQKNNIVAGVVSAVNVAATAYAQTNGAATEETWESVNSLTQSLFENAENDARNRYRFKYSREQEIEADIIAFRFLEFMGIGGDFYIDALKYISRGRTEPLKADRSSTHPTTRFRIELLQHLKEGKIKTD